VDDRDVSSDRLVRMVATAPASQFSIEWRDAGREPECQPDPDYPEGIDIVMQDKGLSCKVDLPYPAKRCGAYLVRCLICGRGVVLSTAGRADDPRSVTMPCREIGEMQ